MVKRKLVALVAGRACVYTLPSWRQHVHPNKLVARHQPVLAVARSLVGRCRRHGRDRGCSLWAMPRTRVDVCRGHTLPRLPRAVVEAIFVVLR